MALRAAYAAMPPAPCGGAPDPDLECPRSDWSGGLVGQPALHSCGCGGAGGAGVQVSILDGFQAGICRRRHCGDGRVAAAWRALLIAQQLITCYMKLCVRTMAVHWSISSIWQQASQGPNSHAAAARCVCAERLEWAWLHGGRRSLLAFPSAEGGRSAGEGRCSGRAFRRSLVLRACTRCPGAVGIPLPPISRRHCTAPRPARPHCRRRRCRRRCCSPPVATLAAGRPHPCWLCTLVAAAGALCRRHAV